MIGTRVWLFDSNQRDYKAPDAGPIYRAHFVPHTITDQTCASWILDNGYKIDKRTRTLRKPDPSGYYGLSRQVYWSQAAVDDACWVDEQRPRIVRAVQECDDAQRLKAVEAALHA